MNNYVNTMNESKIEKVNTKDQRSIELYFTLPSSRTN